MPEEEEFRAKITVDTSDIDKSVAATQDEINKATVTLIQYQMFLRKLLALTKRMGLPEDINQVIAMIQRVNMMIRQMRIAMMYLQAAQTAFNVGTGPVGWFNLAMGAMAGATSLMAMADLGA